MTAANTTKSSPAAVDAGNKAAPRFHDRQQAGRALVSCLSHYRGYPSLLVLGLPRGGVTVGFEVARALDAPLDVMVVRKLGFPGHTEYAMGAIASGGVRVMNPVLNASVRPEALMEVVTREQDELIRREQLYRNQRPANGINGHTVILIDDGLATGATMRSAVQAVRQQRPARLVVAVPVGAAATCQQLADELHAVDAGDELVCLARPERLQAVSLWYQNFPQTTDDEVQLLLQRARTEHGLSLH